MNTQENNTDRAVIYTWNGRRHGIDGSTIKWIAMLTMLIDHIGAIILEGLLKNMTKLDMVWLSDGSVSMHFLVLYRLDDIFRGIGRLGFPLFCFLLIEGIMHTSNIKKYARNLLIFAIISEIPFDLGFSGRVWDFSSQSVFLTLLIGLLAVKGIQYLEYKDKEEKFWFRLSYPMSFLGGITILVLFKSSVFTSLIELFNGLERGTVIRFINRFGIFQYLIIGVVALVIYGILSLYWRIPTIIAFAKIVPVASAGIMLAELLRTDYGGFGVVTIIVMYLYRRRSETEMMAGCIALTILSMGEIPAFLNVLLVKHYNGARGNQKYKYLFYIFYPAHILVLFGIAKVMGIL